MHKKGLSYILVIIILLTLVAIFMLIIAKYAFNLENQGLSSMKSKKNELLKIIENNNIASKKYLIVSPYVTTNEKLSLLFKEYGINNYYITNSLEDTISEYNVIVILNNLFNVEKDYFIQDNATDYSFYDLLGRLGFLNTTNENIYYKNGLMYTTNPIEIPKDYNIILDNGTVTDNGDSYSVTLTGAKIFYFYPTNNSATSKYYDYYFFYNNVPENIYNSKVIVFIPSSTFRIVRKYDSVKNNLVLYVYYPRDIDSDEINKIYKNLHEGKVLLDMMKEYPDTLFIVYSDSSIQQNCKGYVFLSKLYYEDKEYQFSYKRYCIFDSGFLLPYENSYLDYSNNNFRILPFFKNPESYKFIFLTLLKEVERS